MEGYGAYESSSSYRSHSDDRRRDDRDRGDRRHRDYDREDRHRDRGHGHDDRRDRDRYDDRRRNGRDDRREERGGDRDRRDRDPYGRDSRDSRDGGRGYSPRRRDDRDRDRVERDWRSGGGGRDDRGGGGRGGGMGGGGGGGGGRSGGRRRDSPHRSPTPPGAIPLEERVVEPSLWDIAPPQFEGISALEAKMTGMFTYGPGRVAPPLHLGLTSSAAGMVNPLRQVKRVYIGGITADTKDKAIEYHFNNLMVTNNKGSEPGKPIVAVQINREKLFAVIEFRTAEEAKACLEFDGTKLDDLELTVKRPKAYVGIDPQLGFMGGTGDNNQKLFVGGLPTNLNSDQVMELLKSFGELRTFNLVKEGNGSISKGFAFVEFLDPSVTDMAIQGLNGFQIGDRQLVVQRAATTARATEAANVHSAAEFLAKSKILEAAEEDGAESRVMLMLNMVTSDELYDDQEYADILEDVRDECQKYGEVEGVRIPRPVPKSTKWETSDSAAQTAEKNRRINEENGVGRVYIMYDTVQSARKAMKALGGRQFAGRTILVAAVTEEEFLGPAPPPPPSPPPAPEDGYAPPPPPEDAPAPPAPESAPPPPAEEDVDATAKNLLGDLGL